MALPSSVSELDVVTNPASAAACSSASVSPSIPSVVKNPACDSKSGVPAGTPQFNSPPTSLGGALTNTPCIIYPQPPSTSPAISGLDASPRNHRPTTRIHD